MLHKTTKTHKSKPKQRTNWKQRALHCEEVIGVQNELAKAAEVRMSRYIYSAAEAIKRAESAEKHNALLLGNNSRHCQICSENVPPTCDGRCELIKFWKCPSRPTHWQRFKSWLGVWKIAVLCVLFILCGLRRLYCTVGSERCRIAQRASNAQQSAFG